MPVLRAAPDTAQTQTYPGGQLYIALTDTFNSNIFFKEFSAEPERAQRWKGLRQDSGSPETFTKEAVRMYKELGIDPKSSQRLSDGEKEEWLNFTCAMQR